MKKHWIIWTIIGGGVLLYLAYLKIQSNAMPPVGSTQVLQTSQGPVTFTIGAGNGTYQQ